MPEPDRIIAFGDELARRKIKVVIRHVVVPGITDTEEEARRSDAPLPRGTTLWVSRCCLITPWASSNMSSLAWNIRSRGVPAMDKGRMPALREAVCAGCGAGRAAEHNCQG